MGCCKSQLVQDEIDLSPGQLIIQGEADVSNHEEVFNDISLSSHVSEFPVFDSSHTKTQDSLVCNTRSTSNSLHHVESAFLSPYAHFKRTTTEQR